MQILKMKQNKNNKKEKRIKHGRKMSLSILQYFSE